MVTSSQYYNILFNRDDINVLCFYHCMFPWQGFDPDQVTASLSLMKRRNDEFKPLLYRTPKNILPRERPRSSSYVLSTDWRKSLADMEEQKESGALK